jgi:hypothetical protein
MADSTKTNPNWPDPDQERAQPGDVLGIERGGETTNLGDTAEEEDRRRREALAEDAENAENAENEDE